jgi:hypothetical protein
MAFCVSFHADPLAFWLRFFLDVLVSFEMF